MKQWADAQKLAYGKGAGWLVRVFPLVSWGSHGTKLLQFWNFKLEISTLTADLPRQWYVLFFCPSSFLSYHHRLKVVHGGPEERVPHSGPNKVQRSPCL